MAKDARRGSTARRNALSRFLRKDQDGTTAVEFALIFPVFAALMYFIFQSAYTYLAHHTLDFGVHETARLVRTGQITHANLNKQKFKETICSYVALGKSECLSQLAIEVVPVAGGDPDFSPPTKNNKLDDSNSAYDTGGSSSLMMIKAFLPATHLNRVQDVINELPGVADKARPDIFIRSVSLFRNEPF